MILPEDQVEDTIAIVKDAFPHFQEWEYNNCIDEDYKGFSVWGIFSHGSDPLSQTNFFITFDAYTDQWVGYLTVGQPAYFWSSADCGDAYLLSTECHETLDQAIEHLKSEIFNLLNTFVDQRQ
jgi:hypothetical protein